MAIHNSGVAVGIAIILILLLSCPNTLAQTSTVFDSTTRFNIPAYNSAINFALIGTYASATFANNTWTFTNLSLNQSNPANLEISTENSNVTVIFYGVSFFSSDLLSYFVQGQGQQVINMGLGASAGRSVDWVVFSNDTFVTNGWSVSQTGTVTVTGLTGNVSVFYFGFTNELGNNNLPFYEQHSVAIAVVMAVVVTVGVAVAINIVVRKRSVEGETNENA